MAKDFRHNRRNLFGTYEAARDEIRRRRAGFDKRESHRNERRTTASELRGVRLGVA